MTIFDCFFGWRKASRCKKLIRKLQNRLKLLKNRRQSVVRTVRDDVAQLIKLGYQDLAFERVVYIFEDETVLELYELLENFSEFIVSHLLYIRLNEDCPNDINEAVSSLIFASARIGNVPELRAIRKLFSERYGPSFETAALELHPGNLVNFQVKEKLSNKPVPDEMKMKLLQEIAKDSCFGSEVLTIEFASEFHQEAKEKLSTKPVPDNIKMKLSEEIAKDDCLQPEILAIEFASEFQQQISQENPSPESHQPGTISSSMIKLEKETEESSNTIYDSMSDSDSSRKRVVKPTAQRRPKRRSLSRDYFIARDTQCMIYYDKADKNNQKRRKNSKTASPLTRKEEKPLGAMSMPRDQLKESHSDNIQRSVSLPVASPRHVHPKLPDYDEIAANFMALKKEQILVAKNRELQDRCNALEFTLHRLLDHQDSNFLLLSSPPGQ